MFIWKWRGCPLDIHCLSDLVFLHQIILIICRWRWLELDGSGPVVVSTTSTLLNVSLEPRFHLGSEEESKCFNFPHFIPHLKGVLMLMVFMLLFRVNLSTPSSAAAYQNGHTLSPHMLGGPINFTLKLYFPLYSAAATKVSLSLCTTRWGVGGNEIYSSK